ncbi:putative threonine synthase [Methanocella paludicola SANAE]|uniref:Threonine synthase n=1 Tax=Methanocella paludicola (strain DSM 17711 / JCM 13418 / NBRC 101707 / SANAE) TaxID=304371 RepID=D1YX79_METPS|nr:pyridoxal-phosphate dependent enzyme [Methanocella paludicola]BAI61051.1 putative threonine synthase [Methanocella paludicola SANAE]
MRFSCGRCGKSYPIDGLAYKCSCGGLFTLRKEGKESVDLPVSLGETNTPLLRKEIYGARVYFKMDHQMPTGSFKDRGSVVLVNKLKEMGIGEVVEDSSGNAGASIAAYCAAAGIKCHIYVPESTPAAKLKQISAYGADIVKVPGPRENAAKAAQEAAGKTYYASHVYNPLFFEGTKSMAYETYVQMGFPDTVFVPAGNGTMLIGAYIGFKELGFLPRLIAVQSENCCPLYNKFYDLPDAEPKPTIAEGIAIAHPPRLEEMASAIRESGGSVMTVSDDEIRAANETLRHMGIYVEDTSAVVVAGARRHFKNGINNMRKVVLPLTGSGLKT